MLNIYIFYLLQYINIYVISTHTHTHTHTQEQRVSHVKCVTPVVNNIINNSATSSQWRPIPESTECTAPTEPPQHSTTAPLHPSSAHHRTIIEPGQSGQLGQPKVLAVSSSTSSTAPPAPQLHTASLLCVCCCHMRGMVWVGFGAAWRGVL